MKFNQGFGSYFRPVGHELDSVGGNSLPSRSISLVTSGMPSTVPGSGSATRTELLGKVTWMSGVAGPFPHALVGITRAKKVPFGPVVFIVVPVSGPNCAIVSPGATPACNVNPVGAPNCGRPQNR